MHIGDVLYAGIIHEDIERPEFFLGGANHVGDLAGLGHVSRRIACGHTEFFFDSGANFLDLGFIAEAVKHDIGAVLRESARSREADP
jgi:hypothetical protein